METKKVNAQGHVVGLKAYAGREVIILPRPTFAVPRSEKVEKVLGEFKRYVREHRNLSATQYKQFTKQYGDPAERVREYASKLTPAEFKARAAEIEKLVQRRVVEIANDVEARYEALEAEIDETVDRLFGRDANGAKEPKTVGSNGKKRARRPKAIRASEPAERTGPGEVPLGSP